VDPILGTQLAYKADPDANKVDLGIGAARDDNGKPMVFPVVRKIEEELAKDLSRNKEYLPIDGLESFVKGASVLLFGKDHPILASGRVCAVQTLSGTGSLRIGFEFVKNYIPRKIYVSNPTWGNHHGIIKRAGLEIAEYPYFNAKTKSLDEEGMLKALEDGLPGSVVLLHACAHNPTGVDPSQDMWKRIADVLRRKSMIPYFDSAYQGFASGDVDKDAWAIRYFVEQGFQMIISQSFAKNMGLYGERVGTLQVVCANKETAQNVLSQIKIVVRQSYSNPPIHGASIASRILNNPTLYE
jgi:aspartate aminotransferase